MKFLVLLLFLSVPVAALPAQKPAKTPAPPKPPEAPATAEPATEKIAAPTAAPPPATLAPAEGFMEPAQVKALLHKIWLVGFRLNDLLTDVKPQRWKISDAARHSFEQTLESARKILVAQQDWRKQFEGRPDSMYLGYELYVAMNALLPRLDGVAHSVSQNENTSFGAQFSEAEGQLFDLQQELQPYLSYLMRNRDQVLYATQTNLASCQNELGYALRNREGAAKPMRNIAPAFKGHPRKRRAKEAEEKGKEGKEAAKSGEKKSEPEPPAKPGEKK
jgi:hypothetical protein